MNSQVWDFFTTTVSVRAAYSPPVLNLFLEKIMQQTLRDHPTPISISGRPIHNLPLADDIEFMGGSNGELQDLTNRLVDRATAYGMAVSTEKSKTMTKSTNSISQIFERTARS